MAVAAGGFCEFGGDQGIFDFYYFTIFFQVFMGKGIYFYFFCNLLLTLFSICSLFVLYFFGNLVFIG